MFKFKNKKDSIDYGTLNELILLFDKFLKLIFVATAIFVLTYLAKEWKIFSIVATIINIMVPFFIGIALAWLFDPFVTMLQKKGVKRILGTTLIYLIFIAFLILFFSFIVPTLYHQINDIINKSPAIIKDFSEGFDKLLFDLSGTYNLNFKQIQTQVYSNLTTAMNSLTVDLPALIVGFVKGLIEGGLKFIFGLFIGFYLLVDFDGAKNHFNTLLPKKYRKKYTTLFKKLDAVLKNYVLGTLFVIAILFICQTVGFTLAGLEAPLVFGLICAITNVIPYVGPYIGGIPAVLIGLTISPAVGFLTLIAVVICQLIESYLLTPMVMSKTMKLHPVVIIVGLLIFGHFFGIIGMLFATPTISCAKIIANFFIAEYKETKGA